MDADDRSESSLPFEDREDAAKRLLAKLTDLKGRRPLVLGIPRGAIPMAKIIADGLDGELDMVLVKKIGHPLHPEFAVGSVTEDGEIFLGLGATQSGMTEADLEDEAIRQIEHLRRKRQAYSNGKPAIDPKDRTVVIVDDGIATGATMTAAIHSLRARGARKIVVAAPVASRDAVAVLELTGADVRALFVPEPFGAVGSYYRKFTQVSDAEVGAFFRVKPADTDIEADGVALKAIIGCPRDPVGVVIFAHGSGSGRLSPRNQLVAETLNRHGIATVLADLLTETEARMRAKVFDVHHLSERLITIAKWTRRQEGLKGLKIGLFGASTGAGAALEAAARLKGSVHAVVSRGGRPDLAESFLEHVRAPTLLIVGGNDIPVIAMNQSAYRRLKSEKRIEIVEKATHLFEEPGALEKVAELAVSWFRKYLGEAAHPERASSIQP